MLSKSQSNAEAWIFIATGINKFISHLQNNFIYKKKKIFAKQVYCNDSYFD